MSINVRLNLSINVNIMTTTSQKNLADLEAVVKSIKADITSKDVAIEHLKKSNDIHHENEAQTQKLIKSLQKRIEALKKENDQLKQIDENDSKAKEVLVDVLTENKSLKESAKALSDELEDATLEVEETATIATNLYGRFTQVFEEITGDGVISKKSIRNSQSKVVEDMAQLVAKECSGYTPAAMARMFNAEKHRVRMKNRKFKQANLKDMKKLWRF